MPPPKLQKYTYFFVTDNSLYLDVRLLNAVSSNDPDVIKFLMVMALCNTVVPVKRQGTIFFSALLCIFVILCCSLKSFHTFSNDGTVSYKAQSQDEEALVTAASNLNMMLISKDSSTAGQ